MLVDVLRLPSTLTECFLHRQQCMRLPGSPQFGQQSSPSNFWIFASLMGQKSYFRLVCFCSYLVRCPFICWVVSFFRFSKVFAQQGISSHGLQMSSPSLPFLFGLLWFDWVWVLFLSCKRSHVCLMQPNVFFFFIFHT